MLVYRIGRTKFAKDITGEGARLNGGRWNNMGFPCIYAADSRALAMLEYTVNVNIEDIPRALSITTFEIPDTGFYELKEADLPGDWKNMPAPSSTKELGSRLLNTPDIMIIKVPSTVITEEFNYIIKPVQPGNRHLQILQVKDFVYDPRVKGM